MSVSSRARGGEGAPEPADSAGPSPDPAGPSPDPAGPSPDPAGPSPDAAGTVLTLDVGAVAHGGLCVARHDGRVVFVRHALPGERVRARVTGTGGGGRFLRADAVEVLVRSADRVEPPCRYAGAGRCGGCDWQHADLAAQRALKAAVVREQLARLAGLDVPVTVQAVPGDRDGLGWRTEITFAVDRHGRAGLHPHRSNAVLPVSACLLAAPPVAQADVPGRRWPGARTVLAVAGTGGPATLVVTPRRGARRVEGPARVRRRAAGRDWTTAAGGFWQVHPGAADTLVGAVVDLLDPRPGEDALDLYAGAGLFSAALAARVGPGGRVTAVEGDRRAVADARANLGGEAPVPVVHGDVAAVLDTMGPGGSPRVVDLAVLDPPRSGAGPRVCARLAQLAPRAVAYVACDPAALARDVAAFGLAGYRLAALRAYDLFPMTHHVECVALLEPAGPAGAPEPVRR